MPKEKDYVTFAKYVEDKVVLAKVEKEIPTRYGTKKENQYLLRSGKDHNDFTLCRSWFDADGLEMLGKTHHLDWDFANDCAHQILKVQGEE